MKLNYVDDYHYIPLWDTEIVFNEQPNGYYEKIIIGLAQQKDNDWFAIPIIQSCGNGCGDNRILTENDDTVPNHLYTILRDWIEVKIKDLNENQGMFISLIDELNELSRWIEDQNDQNRMD